MDIGIFVIDFSGIINFFTSHTTYEIIIGLMAVFGWLIFFGFLFFLLVYFLEEYKQEKYKEDWKWVLLAVDIPALNVQTPLAVEQMFAHLAGAFDSPDYSERFRTGYKQRWFSFEIISIEGYIQFLVRTEDSLRDLTEAAIYAQYPEAEIVEVEDYVDEIPDKYPNDDYDVWMADFGLAEGDSYPIRTYREFEHAISKDTVLKDPMGTFLESFSRIGPGEQMWFQILIEPISNSWKEKIIQDIKNLIGEKMPSSRGKLGFLTNNMLVDEIKMGLDELIGQLTSGGTLSMDSGKSEEASEEQNKIRYMTPGQIKILEAMEQKITKIGFKTKMRGGYIARKEVFRPERGIQALIGAINQFNIPSANSIVPLFGIKASYFFKNLRAKYRKELLVKAYKKRKISAGAKASILNIEELATIWHFPMSHVKTPLLQKAEGKKAEPPPGLPIEGSGPAPETESPVGKSLKKHRFKTDAGDVAYGADGMKFG